MSLRTKVFAAAAAMALIGGAGLSATTASAATPSCGHGCVDLFSHDFGTTRNPAFLLDTYKQGEHAGQPIILFRQSNSDPAEDFTVSYQGEVSDFYESGLVSAALDLHYGAGIGETGVPSTGNGFADDLAFELQYAPYGVDSGLCMGVAETAAQNTPVTLQPCGVSGKTVWVTDDVDLSGNARSIRDIGNYQIPLINGSDTNFSLPYVLTYPTDGYPTDAQRPELITQQITGSAVSSSHTLTAGEVGTVDSNQRWSADFGIAG